MNKPTIIYTTHSADGCTLKTRYEPFPISTRYKSINMGEWSPREPERETSSAEIELKWTGGRRHELLLDGDQHRDLEDHDMLPELFARFADGDDPDVALEEVLERLQAPSP
ncbi:hypothetical protein LMG667_03415 [Xanthomonas euvesicatoria]|uniref:hypothetical protein n=1 Tax=Xanthomonas euvesicatoria TaxID=456327 RepID=UPI00080DAF20|nr:hypothetical protein [Xanthomonas euvesicatoria]OCG90032.1 hypothetical protein LMG667_03415 [Xanthomonas euvesicatoria]